MPVAKQTLANHARYVPLYHFVCFGLIVGFTVHAVRSLLDHPSLDAFFQVVLALALVLLAFYARAFALGAQDRVIRLELTLRTQGIAPELAPRVRELTPGQFTALRFAGDGELPALMREVLEGKLTRGSEIKKRITDWQADDLRV